MMTDRASTMTGRTARLLVSSLQLAALLLGSSAWAGGVQLVWSSTTGSGATGGQNIDAEVGDVLELDVVVTPDGDGLTGVSLSLDYDTPMLDAVSAEECPLSPLNAAPGSCGLNSSELLQPITFGPGSGATSVGSVDFDGDGVVGLPDFAEFGQNFGQSVPPADPKYDLDSDGVVSLVDFIYLATGYGAPGVTGLAPGAVRMLEAEGIAANAMQPFTLARIRFDAAQMGPASVSVTHLSGIDGYSDGSYVYSTGYTTQTASVRVFPAPGVVDLIWSSSTGAGTPGGPTIDAEVGDVLELDVLVTPDASGMDAASLSLTYDTPVLNATGALECPPPNPTPACTNGLVPTTPGAGSTNPLIGGSDFNGDGFVGIPDFVEFRAVFGMSVPPADPKFDQDMDDVITGVDYLLFTSNYGAPGLAGFVPGSVQMLEAQQILTPPSTSQVLLARVSFAVTAAGGSTVDATYLPRVDGFSNGFHWYRDDFIVNTATVSAAAAVPSLPWSGWAALAVLLAALGVQFLDGRRHRRP